MTSETARLREDICLFARSMFDRGLTHGSTGNISARLSDGGLLVTPTGSSFGRLDPARLARFDPTGRFVEGDAPTKEMPLHSAFYETSQSGAVVHLHSTHSVALSILPETDPGDVLPPLTAYSAMKLGRVKLLPFFVPGDPRMGDAIRELAGGHPAVLLAHHGPVVAGADLYSAVDAIEELEASARLALLTYGMNPQRLSAEQIEDIQARSGLYRRR
jgi:ribulose-5-phosphate 4-epimerase/fuculose-1-phosphate aldolase